MLIGFVWGVNDALGYYMPLEKSFPTYEECKNSIFPHYKDYAVISLVKDNGEDFQFIIDIIDDEKPPKIFYEDDEEC